MGSKTCIYMLQRIRQLQSCSSLVGMSFSKFPKNYRSEATLPLPSDPRTLRPPFSSVTVPIRSVSHESSPINQEKNMTSDWVDGPLNDSPAISDGNHVSPLNEQVSLTPDELSSTPKMTPSYTVIALNKCTTPRDVLNVFSRPSYRKDELFQGVLKLWNTFLALNEKQKLAERDSIVGHPHFHNLTHGILKMAPVMSPEALIRMLYVFVRLQIYQQSKLIQNLLLICQEHLTCFNEVELAILANTLEWLKSDKNVDLITFGLRLMIDMKIEEVNEVTPLLTMMKAIGRTAPLRLKLKLENKALQMVDRFNVAQSENLFCVLADIDFYSEHLLNACSDKLIDGLDGLSYTKIVSLLSCCCELDYGNERLLTAVGDQIMKTICLWKPWQLAMILQYFVHLHFRHVPLLDRYAEIFTNNLSSVKIWDLSETVKFYSALNHLPEKKTQFLEAVNSSLQAYLNSIPPKKLLFIVYNLCVLEACPDFAVNKLLQYESILNFKEQSIFEHINLCLMRNTPFVKSNSFCCLKKVPPATSEDFQTLHNDMKNFIKDPDLYQYSLQIANTYYIDFVLALDTQDNKLVPVGDLQTDNLELADHSENVIRIAVLCCTPNAFALGTLHPLGKLALKIRILKSFGFSVLVLPMHKFVRMTEEHKVKYLRTIIFQELSDDQSALEGTTAEGGLEKTPHDT
ncbi:FAST kinase domain-containing protein 2, mitochondrial [Rana temporaria]|uniref:FAST kinase domain-containing protein 2, mitochondrial n=1 Tax=Rana temporaria TaxID=8407 RepID=UPI001AAC6627|nr:FAST kinase domain-containing protein 2, mitochondrial [Rana temporaria]